MLYAAVASAATLTLEWDDNSSNEVGFAIERATAGTFAEIARVPANVTTYVDTTCQPGTAYSYRLRAFNAGGFSAYSNTATGTTLPLPPAAPSNANAKPPPPVAVIELPLNQRVTLSAMAPDRTRATKVSTVDLPPGNYVLAAYAQ